MATAPILILEKGARKLDLMTGRYKADFVPPDTTSAPQFAMGGAGWQRGGALVNAKPMNRQHNFTLHVRGLSEQEVRKGIVMFRDFLNWAGDESEPLYLHYRPSSDYAYEPLWGQASYWYEVAFGDRGEPQMNYSLANLRDREALLDVTATLKPRARGQKQRVASAAGGIWDDTWGTPDGASRGIWIPEDTANLVTNPFFAHQNWNNDWTAEANVTVTQNTLQEFLLPGQLSSAKIVGEASSTNRFYILTTATAATYALWAIVKRPDGAAVTTADMRLTWDGNLQTETFVSLGNGWYLVRCSVSASATADRPTGVTVATGRTIYLAFLQFENKAYPTAPCWGDLLGCAWAGTAHDSTSSRTDARVRVPVAEDTFSLGAGTIRCMLLMHEANTFPNDFQVFLNSATGLRCLFGAGTDAFQLTDNTNSATSSAQSWSRRDKLILHLTWGPSGLVIYRDGASIASVGTYTPPAAGTNTYIGSNTTPASQAPATWLGFEIFPVAMTAAEVLSDYNNVGNVAADDQNIGAIPYLWAKDGDDTVDNCDDGTRDNWVVVGGVPGSGPAALEFTLTLGTAYANVFFSRLAIPVGIYPQVGAMLFKDMSGTADAAACGGEFQRFSLSTSATLTGSVSLSDLFEKIFSGLEYYLITRLKDAGSNLMLRNDVLGGVTMEGEWGAVTSSASYRLFLTGPNAFPEKTNQYGLDFSAVLRVKRSSGGASNLDIDYIAVMPRPVLRLKAQSTYTTWKYRSDGPTYVTSEVLEKRGDEIELMGGMLNGLMSFMGSDGVDPVISSVLTYSSMYVTPTYDLL